MIRELGHVVLKGGELERSIRFYRDILGLNEVARMDGQMAFFSAGEKHHDLAIMALGPGARSADPNAVGLYHVAFKVGDSLEELRAARTRVEERGIPILGMSDHTVSQSLYLADPDGNMVELYVDADPAVWKRDPTAIASVRPLDL